MPSERSIARGSVRRGSFTSPAMAVATAKPCTDAKVSPITWRTPMTPPSKNGVIDSPSGAPCPSRSATSPGTIRSAKTAIFAWVSHAEPPPACR